jgi:hypothetical protein
MPNASQLLGISGPASVNSGQPFNVSVTYRNLGSEWREDPVSGNGGHYHLGSAQPRDNQKWSPDIRWYLPGLVPVPTNGDVTFTVPLTAPVSLSSGGVQTVAFGMVQDGYEWFGPEAVLPVAVNPGPLPPPAALPPWRAHPDDLVSMQILSTGAYGKGQGAISWTNPGPDTLDVRKVRLWTGVTRGCLCDVAATLIRGDGSIVVQQSWDHYAEPTNLDHETVAVFTDDARCLILPGEVLTLGYRFDPFPPLTGGERADHGVTIWTKRFAG